MGGNPWETGSIRGPVLGTADLQRVANIWFASGPGRPPAMCKIGKLAFVAGAEIPKRYLPTPG
jgi:hypothetical protein